MKKGEVNSNIYTMNLSGNIQMDWIYGLVLGDGSIPKSCGRSKSCKLRIGHSPKQFGYIEWKSSLLTNMGIKNSIYFCKKNLNNPKSFDSYILQSTADRFWTELRAKLYAFRNTTKKTRKRINSNILKDCSLNTLLLWFLDDGYNEKPEHRSYGIRLFTYDFSYEEQELIRSWIYDITGAELTIRQSKGYYYLATSRDSEIFKNALRSISPKIECMNYKLISTNKEVPILL